MNRSADIETADPLGPEFQLIDQQVVPGRNVILGPDGEVRVEPKAMQVLCYLAQRGGEVVTRQELLAHIWSDTYSGDEALSRCVSLLRSALGERRSGVKFIETVPKTGYRLVAPVGVPAEIRHHRRLHRLSLTTKLRVKTATPPKPPLLQGLFAPSLPRLRQ